MSTTFDWKKAGFKFASATEMYICRDIKFWKNKLGWSLEKCIENFNKIENFKNNTTEERIKEFYSDEFNI